LDALENSGSAPLVERVDRPASPAADQSAADPTLSRWMFETLQHGEPQQPATPPTEATPAPAANLDMVRLTEDEVPMVVQALWVQEDRPRLPHLLDPTALANATNAGIEADLTLRRRLGDANATALISDVAEQTRQGGRMSYDQVLDYVRQTYGMAEGGVVVPGATPVSIRAQGPAGSAQRTRAGSPRATVSGRQSRPAPSGLPQSIARAVSGADDLLTAHWAGLTDREKADITATPMRAGAVAEAISKRITRNALLAGKPVTIDDRVVEETHRALAPFAPLLPPHYQLGVMKRAVPLRNGQVSLILQRADGRTFGLTVKLRWTRGPPVEKPGFRAVALAARSRGAKRCPRACGRRAVRFAPCSPKRCGSWRR
jgi:hypothetical protein